MHFLCIDDDALNLQVLVDMLHVAGGSAHAFTCGEAGLVALDAEVYDMILVDLRMPGMDGIAFIKQVRTRSGKFKDIPIIVITAEGKEHEREQCRAAGANDILPKPVMMDSLFECVGAVLAKYSRSEIIY